MDYLKEINKINTKISDLRGNQQLLIDAMNKESYENNKENIGKYVKATSRDMYGNKLNNSIYYFKVMDIMDEYCMVKGTNRYDNLHFKCFYFDSRNTEDYPFKYDFISWSELPKYNDYKMETITKEEYMKAYNETNNNWLKFLMSK